MNLCPMSCITSLSTQLHRLSIRSHAQHVKAVLYPHQLIQADQLNTTAHLPYGIKEWVALHPVKSTQFAFFDGDMAFLSKHSSQGIFHLQAVRVVIRLFHPPLDFIQVNNSSR